MNLLVKVDFQIIWRLFQAVYATAIPFSAELLTSDPLVSLYVAASTARDQIVPHRYRLVLLS